MCTICKENKYTDELSNTINDGIELCDKFNINKNEFVKLKREL